METNNTTHLHFDTVQGRLEFAMAQLQEIPALIRDRDVAGIGEVVSFAKRHVSLSSGLPGEVDESFALGVLDALVDAEVLYLRCKQHEAKAKADLVG